MAALTTRQRDLLQLLLDATAPMGSAELAAQMHLTPRQVNYGLKGLKRWLRQQDITLRTTPGVGVELACSAEQSQILAHKLDSVSHFQLVLTSEQRQQLLALTLLLADEPFILIQLQQLMNVSRTTILADLDAMETWVERQGLTLERRPNYGIRIDCQERLRRQALTALLWGEAPFATTLIQMTHTKGLIFSLRSEAALLPIVQKTNEVIQQWNIERSFSLVAYAEAQLGGRFTDDAVLYLAVVLAIQAWRAESGHYLDLDAGHVAWLQSLPVWSVAAQIARRLGWRLADQWPDSEVAGVAMVILTAPRNERWPGDLEIDASFSNLVDCLMERLASAGNLPNLSQDTTLRDGIVIHVIPSCLRQRFNLWMPVAPHTRTLSNQYTFEYRLARELGVDIEAHTGVTLPDSEINNLALLLRAAYIRERPYHSSEVLVVCPSGMATAQLLVARLQTRFPRLEPLKVVSLRELSKQKLATAELIITTVPLAADVTDAIEVIQVHPLLLPEDIAAITRWLA